ncbi:PKD domain-containing protein [Methanosarcina sp. MSH10X1]|uniref:PKD domain-containing protein n=1 Tax=Methanosarcina sp. MSH10X1 TaxID=2507075 RepID=UPI000FFC7670|nr:PKD domain-containing protein [Methanosarcina sp. MSH10X1]RXA21923.1 PKD domain-containing protein [Methanosarcina sp. MSH10X1]
MLILISSAVSATSAQNSSVTGPDGYQNSSIIDPDGYQNSSVTGPYAYITSSDTATVYVIDTATNSITDIIDTETYTTTDDWYGGDQPFGVAVTPDGTRVYVTNEGSGTITVIDTTTNNVTALVDVKGVPRGITVSPDGTKAYVVTASGTRGTVSVIDTATNNVTATVKAGNDPQGVAVSPDGTEVYVANKNSHTVSIIDTARNKLKATVSVAYMPRYSGSGPVGIVVTPDGLKAYVANYYTVSVIDIATKTVTDTVNLGGGLCGVAVSPDGTKVYVANSWDCSVSIIDTATNTVTATVKVGDSPSGIAVTPDGAKVYVPNYWDNTVSVIDTTTDTVIATFNAGSRPRSFGQFIGPASEQYINPAANFNTNVTEGYVPFSVQFTDLSENTTALNWDFENDGIVDSTERNPIYEYAIPGNYTVNLTAANKNGTNSTFETITALEKPVPPASHWEFSPAEPVSGDTLNINGSAFPGEKVNAFVTFEKTVPVSKGKFEYSIKDVEIPGGFDNSFVVEASGAKDLNVRVKKLIWITKSSEASGDIAVVSQSNVPPGTYRVKIDGDAGKGISEVNLKITALQEVKVYSNGDFNYSYKTKAIPPGKFKIKMGNITKEITIKPEKIKKCMPVLPVANFCINADEGYVPLGVQFIDLSKDSTGWNWDFGDGTNSTNQNPEHTFFAAGNYTVNLTATNRNGTDSKLASIMVLEQPVLPLADFDFNTTQNSDSFEVQFTDLSKNATSWNWNFGDGNTSTEQNPVYTYYINLYEEIRYATLTVTNENGTDSILRGVSVGAPEPVY